MSLILLTLGFLLFSPIDSRADASVQAELLVIHSYHQDFDWTEGVDDGLTSVLGSNEYNISIYKEYYDTKRNAVDAVEDNFYSYISEKYKSIRFDAVLTSDDNALRFAAERRNTFFKDIPIIFCGINEIDLYDLDAIGNVTGITEDYDVPSNLELIKKLDSRVENLAVIFDSTPTGLSNLIRFRKVKSSYLDDFNFIELYDLSTAELKESLSGLPENSAVLNFGFWRDKLGASYETYESLSLVARAADCPVYGLWDYFIQGGTVGGIATSSFVQGRLLGEQALKVLKGTPADEIPVYSHNTTRPTFDYYALKKFNIPFSNLPKNSIILNKPDTLYYNDPVLFFLIIITISVLSILSIALSINYLKRKQSERLFESLFNNIPDIVLVHTAEGKILQNNSKAERYYEKLIEELHNFRDYFTAMKKKVENKVVKGQGITPQFQKLVKEVQLAAAGTPEILNTFEVNSVVIDYRSKLAVLSIFRNISNRVKIQQDLTDSLKEKNVLLKEIHHRVKNNLQIISSLLALQASYVKDEAAAIAMVESQNRIMTMASAHEILYKNNDLSNILLEEYVDSLIEMIRSSQNRRLNINIIHEPLLLNIDTAIPLGLIIFELVSNSIRHAFTDELDNNLIEISCKVLPSNKLELKVSDNGHGFDFNSNREHTLGLRLVDALVHQINAEMEYRGDGGSEFVIVIPI